MVTVPPWLIDMNCTSLQYTFTYKQSYFEYARARARVCCQPLTFACERVVQKTTKFGSRFWTICVRCYEHTGAFYFVNGGA